MSLDPLRHVKFFASVKHAGQQYSGGLPYTHHLASVAAVMARFTGRAFWLSEAFWLLDKEQDLLEACWLHDVVEDTETKVKEVAEMFGEEVARLVEAVTNEEGPNRKTRNALTYPKIRAAGILAVRLKLADRIANVETGGNLVSMYRKEHENFKRNLYTQGENEDMWTHLDKLLAVNPNQGESNAG